MLTYHIAIQNLRGRRLLTANRWAGCSRTSTEFFTHWHWYFTDFLCYAWCTDLFC